jgi:hypothetical protein
VSNRELLAEGLNTSLIYPIDAAVTALDAKKTALQNIWNAIDARAQRSQLVQAIAAARAAPVVSSVLTSAGGSVSAGFSAGSTANISGLNATQRTVLANLVGIGRKRGASSKDILAAVETALVEQNLMNGAYGDGTSVGWRQETAGSYGAAVGPRMDLTRTINAFYSEIMGIGQRGTAGQLAQAVQRSAFPGRYDQKQSQALALIAALTGGGIVRGVRSSARGSSGTGNASSVAQAIAALRQFDEQAKRSNVLAKIDLQIKNLTQLKAFKDAIAGLRTQVQGLAQQAAQAWRTLQQNRIDAAHADRIQAIQNGPQSQQLAQLQAIDAQEQVANTIQQNQDALTQANAAYATAVAGGDKVAIAAAVKAQQAAQQTITDFARAQQEQQLQDQINTATAAADKTQTVASAALDQQTADYQTGLDAQFAVLTDQLAQRKIAYATWAAEVSAIVASYGLSVSTDSTTQGAITAGPGPISPVAGITKGSGVITTTRARAGGGPVSAGYPYLVGERGAETFIPDRSGTILTAGQTRRRGRGGDVHMHIGNMNISSHRAAQAMADRLAFRAAIGTA